MSSLFGDFGAPPAWWERCPECGTPHMMIDSSPGGAAPRGVCRNVRCPVFHYIADFDCDRTDLPPHLEEQLGSAPQAREEKRRCRTEPHRRKSEGPSRPPGGIVPNVMDRYRKPYAP